MFKIAHIFRRPDYQSDTTQFIDGLKTAKPSLEAEQRAGRKLLWDKAVNRQLQAEYSDARLPQKPYDYQTDAV